MIRGHDSEYPPTLSQAKEARAAGVRVWGGYFAGPGIAHGWSDGAFQLLKAADLVPIAYCSGGDNPLQLKAHAADLGALLCYDNERYIPYVNQAELDASGGGLYGNAPVHGLRAAFHQIAGYPGYDPQATWGYIARPNTPCGWQWRGGHTEFGTNVDSAWWDDWFGEGNGMTADEMSAIIEGARERRDGLPQPDAQAHPLRNFGWVLANCGAMAGQALVDAEPKPPVAGLAPHTHAQAPQTGEVIT